MLAGNQLNNTHRGGMIAAYAQLVSDIHTGGNELVVCSRFHNKAPRTAGVGTEITRVNVDINLDSQRRRLTGRGQ